MSTKKIEVCLSLGQLKYFDIKGKVVVVIDIFRATTCLTVAVAEGTSQIRVFDDIEKCVALHHNGFLLAGERRGVKIEGFDIGNSPLEYKKKRLKGKKIAVTTTNGTKAIIKSKDARQILLGSFSNFSVLKNYLSSLNDDILLICSGRQGLINIEDTAFAGALMEALLVNDNIESNNDGVLIALSLWQSFNNNLSEVYKKAEHGRRLLSKGFKEDLLFCLEKDTCQVIPICKGNTIEKLNISN